MRHRHIRDQCLGHRCSRVVAIVIENLIPLCNQFRTFGGAVSWSRIPLSEGRAEVQFSSLQRAPVRFAIINPDRGRPALHGQHGGYLEVATVTLRWWLTTLQGELHGSDYRG